MRTSHEVATILGEGIPVLAKAAGVDSGVDWFQKRVPAEPDRCLGIWVRRTMRHPTVPLDGYAVEFHGRGLDDDELDVDELMGPVADWFAELEHVDVVSPGGIVVHINQVRFRSSAPLRAGNRTQSSDVENRADRADVFDLDITPPPSARRPA